MKHRVLSLLSALVLSVGACVAEQTPVEAVRSFLTALEVFDFSEAQKLVCDAQQTRVRDSLQPFLDVVGLGEAFDMSLEDLSFEELSNDGNTAVVRVSGKARMSFLGQQETQEVDEEHLVVKEDGRWVVCDP